MSMKHFLNHRTQYLLVNNVMPKNRNWNIFFLNCDEVIETFIKKWKTHMSYPEIEIFRVGKNVNLIKDKIGENSLYYKSVLETKLWNI